MVDKNHTQNTSVTETSTSKKQVALPAIIIAFVLLLVFVGGMARHFLFNPGPSLSQGLGMDQNSFPSWLNEDAMKCQGQMSKLSPEEQKKITDKYQNSAMMVIKASYALQTH